MGTIVDMEIRGETITITEHGDKKDNQDKSRERR
jgi:hypothetical protein